MSSTKTIPAIASNEYEFQWGREVLFLSNGSQRPTHAQVEPTVRKNRLSLVLRAENMRRGPPSCFAAHDGYAVAGVIGGRGASGLRGYPQCSSLLAASRASLGQGVHRPEPE